MPEADGDEIMKHLKESNVEFDLVMAKVSKFQSVRYAFLCVPLWSQHHLTYEAASFNLNFSDFTSYIPLMEMNEIEHYFDFFWSFLGTRVMSMENHLLHCTIISSQIYLMQMEKKLGGISPNF